MADFKKRLEGNVEGDFFVDSTCENFDTCRQLAPEIFGYWNNYAVVVQQPQTEEQRKQALHAVVSCPKGAIGTSDRSGIKEVFADFPLHIEDEVYYWGFNTPKSAGGNSYFIKHEGGNWMICTPKYVPHLVQYLEKNGGLKYIYISHRDDVGEAAKYAEKFGAEVIIHQADVDAYPNASVVLAGVENIDFSDDFLIIPTPGHTEGHCVLIYKGKFLFSGDTLKFNRFTQRIESWEPDWTWYSSVEQAKSLAKLIDSGCQWLLCTHGQRVKLSKEEMSRQLAEAVKRDQEQYTQEPAYEKRVFQYERYAEELLEAGQPEHARVTRQRAEAMKTALAAGTTYYNPDVSEK